MPDHVYAFRPRSRDYPHFVAEDVEDVHNKLGEYIGGEQCDGCGNHSYRVETAHGAFYAVCAVDPDEDHEFVHLDPCGARYPIQIYTADEVTF